jgi:hypothetical protein
MYGSPEAAEAALAEREMAVVKQRAEAALARARTDAEAERIKTFLVPVEQAMAQRRAEAEMRALPTIEASTAYDPGGVRGGKAPDLEGAAKTTAELAKMGEKPQDVSTLINVRGAPVGYAKNPTAHTKVQDGLTAIDDTELLMDRMEDLLSKPRTWALNPQNRAAAAAVSRMLLISVNKAGGLGALDNGTVALMSGLLPTEGSWESVGKAQLAEIRNRVQAQKARILSDEVVSQDTGKGIGAPPVEGAVRVE